MSYINQKLLEFENYLVNRNVAIIGLGVSNCPLIEYLYQKKARITVFDEKEKQEIPEEIIKKINQYSIKYNFGKDCLSKLIDFDLIFRSPSCMPYKEELQKEVERGAIVTTEIELLLEMCPCKTIGITGSDGKTTTTTLIHEIIKRGGYTCYLGGNIGVPLFTKLSDIKPEDILILELSSFQLIGMKISTYISVITNISPNHLNIHSNYQEYIESKKNIFKYQNKNSILVLNYDNDITKECAKQANGKVVFFSSETKLNDGFIVDDNIIKECNNNLRKHILNTKDVHLRGVHNYQNICAALAATKTLVDEELAVEAITTFTGVEHRLEFVREIEGVKWYNDSVSSSPSRTIAGLNSFDEDIVLIAGGYDKNLDYEPLAKPIVDKVTKLILIGPTSKKILDTVSEELKHQNKKLEIYQCTEFSKVISTAYKVAKKGEIILFSPASTSFDLFKNFAHRGETFKKLVNDIK